MNRNLPRVTYRPREAVEVTGLSLRFLYYAIQQKDLPTIRVGRCGLTTKKALREWLERKTVPAAEEPCAAGLRGLTQSPQLLARGV